MWFSTMKPTAQLCTLFAIVSLGTSKALPQNKESAAENSLSNFNLLSKRTVTAESLKSAGLDKLWGTELVLEPDDDDEIPWQRTDIDVWVKEAWESVPTSVKTKNDNSQLPYLIAALWVPGIGYTMSSSPGDGGRYFTAWNHMKTNGETDAPAWWSQVKGRLSRVMAEPSFHAEDGACYLYEKSMEKGFKLAAGAKYLAADAPYMTVYGRRQAQAVPGYVRSCDRTTMAGSDLDPDCTTVMRELDISVRP